MREEIEVLLTSKNFSLGGIKYSSRAQSVSIVAKMWATQISEFARRREWAKRRVNKICESLMILLVVLCVVDIFFFGVGKKLFEG